MVFADLSGFSGVVGWPDLQGTLLSIQQNGRKVKLGGEETQLEFVITTTKTFLLLLLLKFCLLFVRTSHARRANEKGRRFVAAGASPPFWILSALSSTVAAV